MHLHKWEYRMYGICSCLRQETKKEKRDVENSEPGKSTISLQIWKEKSNTFSGIFIWKTTSISHVNMKKLRHPTIVIIKQQVRRKRTASYERPRAGAAASPCCFTAAAMHPPMQCTFLQEVRKGEGTCRFVTGKHVFGFVLSTSGADEKLGTFHRQCVTVCRLVTRQSVSPKALSKLTAWGHDTFTIK